MLRRRTFSGSLLLLLAASSNLLAANISGTVTVTRFANSANAVIYIDKIPGRTFVPPAAPARLDQVNLKFEPHVLAIMAGTRVEFPNSDITRHNVFSPDPSQKLQLGQYPQGEIKSKALL